MQTTGQDSTQICVMTQLLRTTFNLFQLYSCNQYPHLTYQYCQETCHIRGLQIKATPPTLDAEDKRHQALLADSIHHPHPDIPPHANCPVQFGNFFQPISPNPSRCMQYNNEFPAYALSVSRFTWAIYSFNSGHFASLISMRNLTFNNTLASNPFAYGHALMEEFTSCKCIFSSARPFWTTFGDRAINQLSMAIWFTQIDSNPANQPVHFGHCRLP